MSKRNKSKSEEKALTTENDKSRWKETEFIPMCGMTFEPAKTGECVTLCQTDSPEEFKKCLAHFKANPVTTVTTQKKATVGTNEWGRRLGSQAELIEKELLNSKPMTVADLATKAGCSASRVRRHFLRLIHKEKRAEVMITATGLVYLPDRFKKLKGVSAYIKNADKKKAQEKLDAKLAAKIKAEKADAEKAKSKTKERNKGKAANKK